MKRLNLPALSGLAAVLLAACATTPSDERGFVSLFDGKTLDGWKLLGKKGDGYVITNGVIACAQGGGGNLLTERQYADFILRFEFRVEPGGNNGLGIRAPMTDKQIAYYGIELQILDDYHPKYHKLRPAQYHGSIYDVVPAKRGAVRLAGGWNKQEVTALGRRITVRLNGQVIVDADLNDVTDPAVLQKHPGLLRERGHIGFLGHNDHVEFRNIRIKELPDQYRIGSPLARNNIPPEGFTALFNGANLAGWQGLPARPNDNPAKRAQLPAEERARLQAEADDHMRAHWSVQNGVLVFDGKGRNLVTARDYADFELLVDWRIHEAGDSGIYLRGTPQVQIWDPMAALQNGVGSGGLFNNKIHPSVPLKRADRYVGEWNRFRILMQGEQVIVFLNDELVVYDEKKRTGVVMENYWERDKPIYPSGPIELQNHGNKLYFKNIYVRELPAKEAAAR
jgi:hypothetical protein